MLFEGISLRQLGPYKGGCPSESQKILGFGILSLVLDDKYVGDCTQPQGKALTLCVAYGASQPWWWVPSLNR